MAQTIKLKRSNQSDSSGVPTENQLELGEVAINTYHGKMYIKKSDEASPTPNEEIVEVGSTERVTTGTSSSGTTFPSHASLFVDSSSTSAIQLGASSWSASYINFGDSADYDAGSINYNHYYNKMGFRTNGASGHQMVIDAAGQVGIGTDNPSKDLHIYRGSSGVSPASDAGLFVEGNFSTSLQLGAYWAGVTRINFGAGGYGSTSNVYNSGGIEYSNYSKYMSFSANTTEKMRINSYGQLLVGTTSNQDTVSKIVTTGRIRSGNFLASSNANRFYNSGVQGYAGIELYSYLTNSATTQKMMSFKASNGTEYGAITITGTAVTYGTGSDERLKENIRDAEDAGDKIDAIKIRQFDWKESGQHQDYGVIAQELDEVAPEAVNKGVTEDDMMQVDYSKLVPTLIKEIQSLRNRVAELEKN